MISALLASLFDKGQARQQVQQFAGVLAIKSTFQDQISTTVKPKVTRSSSIELYLRQISFPRPRVLYQTKINRLY